MMDLNLKLKREDRRSWLTGENLQIKHQVVKTLFLDRLMKPDNVRVLQFPADPRLSLKFLEVWKEMFVEVRGSSLSGHPAGFRRNIVRGDDGGGCGGELSEETLKYSYACTLIS